MPTEGHTINDVGDCTEICNACYFFRRKLREWETRERELAKWRAWEALPDDEKEDDEARQARLRQSFEDNLARSRDKGAPEMGES